MMTTLLALGMAVAAVVFGQPAAWAVLDLDTGDGRFLYAKETLTATVSASEPSDTRTYYVLSAPTIGRLSFSAMVGNEIPTGGAAQVRFRLDGMVFAGAIVPSLAIAGTPSPSVVRASGGASGASDVVFTITAGSGGIAATRNMTLTVRSLGVLVDQVRRARVDRRAGTTGSWTEGDWVTGHDVGSGLRESVSPISPVTKFVDGFRSFAGKLVASLGSLSVGLRPGTGPDRAFSAATSTPVALMDLTGAGQVTFSGNLDFTSDAFLSEEADCSTKDEEGVLDAGGSWAPVSLFGANGRHLCIEVDGTTSIPETGAYRATVSYDGIMNAAFPPGDARRLVLGKVEREGITVDLPYVNTHPNVNFRVVVRNRMDEPSPYRFEFAPPEGTSAVGGPQAEGALPANALTLLRAANFVTVTGRRPWTGARLTVDASPEKLDIVTIQTNRSDGSTDTVRYWPEPEPAAATLPPNALFDQRGPYTFLRVSGGNVNRIKMVFWMLDRPGCPETGDTVRYNGVGRLRDGTELFSFRWNNIGPAPWTRGSSYGRIPNYVGPLSQFSFRGGPALPVEQAFAAGRGMSFDLISPVKDPQGLAPEEGIRTRPASNGDGYPPYFTPPSGHSWYVTDSVDITLELDASNPPPAGSYCMIEIADCAASGSVFCN